VKRARVAVLISGAGTNMAALLYASRADDSPYEVALVISNREGAAGVALAKAEGVPAFTLPSRGQERAKHDLWVNEVLDAHDIDYIALAGYMRILTPGFVLHWQDRMLNIHPSLLPDYKGLDTHARALADGQSHAGCSVHLVTEELDDGPVLGQTRVAILPGDTPETLAARVRIAEHQLYPRVLGQWVMREATPDYWLSRVREYAMRQPEADEVVSHGMPCFGIIKGKKFAYFIHDHHGDGRTGLLVKISGADEQAQLIEQDEEMYFRPAYFGDGWIGIRLDLGRNDWLHIRDWIERSWKAVAPKKLTAMLDAADMF
jgi:phosphoribosylglycinamide formyltransferase 1